MNKMNDISLEVNSKLITDDWYKDLKVHKIIKEQPMYDTYKVY